MEALRNQWYCAAFGHELKQQPLGRTFLNEPVALYRTAAGTPVAFEDRCCHRRAPLSHGRIEGDNLRCLYHGLLYNPDGTAIWAPGQDRLPQGARVRSYPVVESHGWIWIWPGDPELADPKTAPSYDKYDDPKWAAYDELIPMKANYFLVVDNLLDLSHLPFVHAATIGSPEDTNPNLAWERGANSIQGVRVARGLSPSQRNLMEGLDFPLRPNADHAVRAAVAGDDRHPLERVRQGVRRSVEPPQSPHHDLRCDHAGDRYEQPLFLGDRARLSDRRSEADGARPACDQRRLPRGPAHPRGAAAHHLDRPERARRSISSAIPAGSRHAASWSDCSPRSAARARRRSSCARGHLHRCHCERNEAISWTAGTASSPSASRNDTPFSACRPAPFRGHAHPCPSRACANRPFPAQLFELTAKYVHRVRLHTRRKDTFPALSITPGASQHRKFEGLHLPANCHRTPTKSNSTARISIIFAYICQAHFVRIWLALPQCGHAGPSGHRSASKCSRAFSSSENIGADNVCVSGILLASYTRF